jgi:hypothetical protein
VPARATRAGHPDADGHLPAAAPADPDADAHPRADARAHPDARHAADPDADADGHAETDRAADLHPDAEPHAGDPAAAAAAGHRRRVPGGAVKIRETQLQALDAVLDGDDDLVLELLRALPPDRLEELALACRQVEGSCQEAFLAAIPWRRGA